MKIKKFKPMFTTVITTMDKYEKSKVLTPSTIMKLDKLEGKVKEYQKVLAVGDSVRGINVGDVVLIDPIRYAVRKHKEGSLKDGVITDNPITEYVLPTMEIDGKECLKLQDRDIEGVIEEFVD